MEPLKPEDESIKTEPTSQDPESTLPDDIMQGTKIVATRTATTTATTLAGHSASQTLSSTTTAVLGHSGGTFLATSIGQSVLAGGMSSVGAVGAAIFSKDKKRALARGIPSVLIALIPGVGIPLAIGANVVSGLVVDKIYTTIQNRNWNKEYLDLSPFIPESMRESLDSSISKISKKLEAFAMSFAMTKSANFPTRVFEISGKFKKRLEMFEKVAVEKFPIVTTDNFGEHLLLARQFFREKIAEISDATNEVNEVIEFLDNYLFVITNSDEKVKSGKKPVSKEVKTNAEILKALIELNEELKSKIGNDLKSAMEKFELFVASEMERIALLNAPEPKE